MNAKRSMYHSPVGKENIAVGNVSASRTFNQWRNSPPHWALIMSRNITSVGVGPR